MMIMKNGETDQIIQHALMKDRQLDIPAGLAEKVIRKIERRILLKESLLELCMKGGLTVGSLLIITAILVWTGGNGVLTNITEYFFQHWQVITSVIILIIFTVLVDQVMIKSYLPSNNSKIAESRS